LKSTTRPIDFRRTFVPVNETIDNQPEPSKSVGSATTPRTLLAFGIPIVLFNALLVGRMIWEETWLTFHSGPQMLGFSLAHGYFAFLLLAPLLSAAWLIVALIVLALRLWRKRSLSKWYWSTLAAAILLFGILSIPPVFWQWASIRTFARSPYAADLMIYAAAEGDLRTAKAYLDNGVALTATNHDGSTAAYVAAATGRLPVLEMLTAKGADLNAVNLYGDSPLAAAIGNRHTAEANFLKAHGARQIIGTPEQHQAASKAIVQRAIERMNKSTMEGRPSH
jgi:Ankyrin repeats (many copies)